MVSTIHGGKAPYEDLLATYGSAEGHYVYRFVFGQGDLGFVGYSSCFLGDPVFRVRWERFRELRPEGTVQVYAMPDWDSAMEMVTRESMDASMPSLGLSRVPKVDLSSGEHLLADPGDVRDDWV